MLPDAEALRLLVTRTMPFGKHKGTLIADLPGNYLNWFAREGFPPGEIGRLLVRSAPGGITPRMQRLNVVGVFKVGAELDGSMALIHVADAAQMQHWQPNQVQSVRLAVKDLYAAPQVSTAIAKGLDRKSVE